MLVVGLTGGVGSGKSTVAEMLEARGAKIIDADVVARKILEVDQPGYVAVVAKFGDSIIEPVSKKIDRGALAAIVFSSANNRKQLEQMTHPLIRDEIERQLADERGANGENQHKVVVLVIPLLVESRDTYKVDRTVVVDVEPDVAIARLMAPRGWTREQCEERIAAQVSRTERNRAADEIIDNNGNYAQLQAKVEHLWETLTNL